MSPSPIFSLNPTGDSDNVVPGPGGVELLLLVPQALLMDMWGLIWRKGLRTSTEVHWKNHKTRATCL